MKSMLQEATSVENAIIKAWQNAGKPTEFTIKIIEKSEKNFFGFTKKPAIVSVSYNGIVKTDNKQVRPVIIEKKRQEYKNQPTKNVEQKIVNKKNIQENKDIIKEKLIWTPEFMNDVTAWLKQMFNLMEIQANFTTKIERRVFKIFLDKRILKDLEEEKLLFISFSHLLMQSLKKKYKKKFNNFYLIIHTKTTENLSDGDKK